MISKVVDVNLSSIIIYLIFFHTLRISAGIVIQEFDNCTFYSVLKCFFYAKFAWISVATAIIAIYGDGLTTLGLDCLHLWTS